MTQQSSPKPPNVVVILTDDQGWGDLSLNGNNNVYTPHIDALAARGAMLNWFYVQPLCAPTRAEFLTGRSFPRTGVKGVTRRAEYLDLEETTIADVFKRAGYATGCFGKWHSGSAYPYHPNGRGFDEFFGYCCGHWSHYFDSTVEHNGVETRADGYLTDVLTDRAMAFMTAHRNDPFFCYVPFNTPHSPFQVPDPWFDRFRNHPLPLRARPSDPESLDATRSVLAMCENIDDNVGRIIKHLSSLELLEDTVVVYFSDNGPNTWRWNGGMSGKKGSTDEGGVRSPCVIHWPGKIAAGQRIEPIAGAIDLLPTLAELAGITVEGTKPLDGVSLKPLLLEEECEWPERAIFAHSHDGTVTGIRTQQYRAGGHTGGLYDMYRDIGQQQDVSAFVPELAAELNLRAARWSEQMAAERDRHSDDRPLPVGYPAFPVTYLNAQDGIPTGGIRWSSVHPNASYFIQWGSTEETMSWEIEVHTSGMYEISMKYGCFIGEEGSEIEVSFNGAQIRAVIENPFEAPLKDQDDRVQRDESYEKEFTHLRIGTLEMQAGRGVLKLQASHIAGRHVADVRALSVRLIEA
ncbi:arylsulfatase [Paenibacillus sp. F411]|uniref:arylsulfatase n=1 Tax=Paenibacillus sp. F411 TaxID=2820239 RepID=UPI001AAF68B9|nr:arylsulfatase [Paenibacillus sp. F411]MBO2944383.1 arylsulfatase [Paenibacillus sp. F411]